jgi:hypothetical protein
LVEITAEATITVGGLLWHWTGLGLRRTGLTLVRMVRQADALELILAPLLKMCGGCNSLAAVNVVCIL